MEITETITSMSISLAFFAAIVLSLYFYFRARHQERMAMIEKGYQPPPSPKKDLSLRSLKWGVFFIGLALGLFMGYVLATYTRIDGVISFFSMIMLFGGASLIFNYYLERKSNNLKING